MKTDTDISPRMTLLLATACGMIVANLYYAQTLVGPIARATGLAPELAGFIVTLTQVGYALGLLFLVPLGDLLENRRLVVTALAFSAVALLVASLSTNGAVFLAAALAIGLSSVAAQVLVPFAAHLSKEATRGATVGKVVSGLLLGIMLARPVASLVADHANWHVVFGGAAVLMAVLAVVLFKNLPQRHPQAPLPYPKLIGSLWHLVLHTPVLRRRALYQAGLFGSFSLFWTVVPQELTSVEFGLSQTGVAIFALVGMAGAIASPVAGRLADSGHTLFATAAALVLGIVGYALPLFSTNSHTLALAILVAASIILDMAVAASLVLGQRAIFALAADIRSRLNGLFFALTFAGGALGSALGGWMYASHGWHAALLTGMAFVAIAFAGWLVEYAGHAASGRAVKPQ
jgi:predicted MFS family arabinose efflux permease